MAQTVHQKDAIVSFN